MPFFDTNDRAANEWPDTLSESLRLWCLAFLAIIAILCTTSALAASSDRQSTAKNVYQTDRAKCNSGQTNQDRATCLQEARAAYGEARRGQLVSDPDRYEQNAMARCNNLPPQDQQACQIRARDGGITEGSVMDGGVYRSMEIPVSRSRND